MSNIENDYQDLKREREAYRHMLASNARPGCACCNGVGQIMGIVMCPCVHPKHTTGQLNLIREYRASQRVARREMAAA